MSEMPGDLFAGLPSDVSALSAEVREARDREACDALSAALLAMDRGDLGGASQVLAQVPADDAVRLLINFLFAMANGAGPKGVESLAHIMRDYAEQGQAEGNS